MIKKLRVRFIAINSIIVFTMLCIIFMTIMGFTKYNLIKNSVEFMEGISSKPILTLRLGDEGMQYPFFIIDVDEEGASVIANKGYYDISNRDQVDMLLEKASQQEVGEIGSYGLRYYSNEIQDTQRIIFIDISNERETIQVLAYNLLAIGAMSFILFFIISVFLSHWVAKPAVSAWKQQNIFISDASHEIRTPLTIITTNAEMIEKHAEDVEMIQKRTEHILASADRMKTLTNNLLSFVKIENSAHVMDMESINLSEIVDMEGLAFEALFFEKGLTLEIEVEKNLYMKGNTLQINQLISILLDNAYKYSQPQGKVSLALKKINGKYVMLHVSNQGETMNKEDLEKIFNRFYRLDSSRSKEEGCGLGLSIGKMVVKQHKGIIWAESSNGVNDFLVKLKYFEKL